MNTQLINDVQRLNVEIAREDDDKDAANRAAKESFLGNTAKQMSELAQLREQRDYMISRDEKLMAQDEKTAGLIGSRRYGMDEDYNVVFNDTTTTTAKFKKGVKKKKLTPGAYTMLADGTIILK